MDLTKESEMKEDCYTISFTIFSICVSLALLMSPIIYVGYNLKSRKLDIIEKAVDKAGELGTVYIEKLIDEIEE